MDLPPSSAAAPRHRLLTACCLLLVVFLVLFPKGGIKAGPLPITWGYLLLVLFAPFAAAVRLLQLSLRQSPALVAALALLLPFQFIFLYGCVVYGVQIPPFTFATFVSLFVLPWLFLFVYAPFLPLVRGDTLARWFCLCIFLAAAWGLLLFFLHPFINKFIEVPYLTVNAADYGQIERTKHIQRGFFYKLISTYNNGNVYGVATLVLYPMYRLLEKARWRRFTVMAALLLTLSRTVWAGLLFAEIMPLFGQLWDQARTFPVVRVAALRKRLLLVAVTGAFVAVATFFISNAQDRLAFLFDPAAGGRSAEVSFQGLSWLPNHAVPPFNEVIYGTALQGFGVLGLLAFLLIFLGPLLLLLLDTSALRSPLRSAALSGLVLYAFLGLSDGALDYIPVMAFYWFAYMIYLCGWPGHPPAAAPAAAFASPPLLLNPRP